MPTKATHTLNSGFFASFANRTQVSTGQIVVHNLGHISNLLFVVFVDLLLFFLVKKSVLDGYLFVHYILIFCCNNV